LCKRGTQIFCFTFFFFSKMFYLMNHSLCRFWLILTSRPLSTSGQMGWSFGIGLCTVLALYGQTWNHWYAKTCFIDAKTYCNDAKTYYNDAKTCLLTHIPFLLKHKNVSNWNTPTLIWLTRKNLFNKQVNKLWFWWKHLKKSIWGLSFRLFIWNKEILPVFRCD